jgi:hypothetical protein
MHDCNRLRENGYRDKTWIDRIPYEFVDDFIKNRNYDLKDRDANSVNRRFPSL